MPSKDTSFNPNIPVVHSINSFYLELRGWKKEGSVFKKNNQELRYDGVHWMFEGRRVQFFEDLNKINEV